MLGRFPQQDPLEIDGEILRFAALQLGNDADVIRDYAERRQTVSEHQRQIREYLSLQPFDARAADQYTYAHAAICARAMWPDNETERDYLNFSTVSDTVAEIVVQAQGRPISIGVSGAWGTGKSSMIRLIQASLSHRASGLEDTEFVFVQFNAWLYQGYDDARAALMEVIASRLETAAREQDKPTDKAKALLKRINWFRAAKLVGGSTVAMSLGLPPIGLLGELFGVGRRALDHGIDGQLLDDGTAALSRAGQAASALLHPEGEASSPPKEIQALRDEFEQTLDELGFTLVVLVDDLDRCLPETTISTLEAIRLFLFLKNAAFVIAADIDVVKLAVRRHFDGTVGERDDLLVTNYFDKLIQVPIRVPPLGIQEVRAYMMLLFVEDSSLSEDAKERIRARVCEQLRHTWQGHRVDHAFINTLGEDLPPELTPRFDTADRLAPVMTSTSGVDGNPRLIKRFLNALSIRMAIARSQGVGVDEAVLAKLLILERHGAPKAFHELTRRVGASPAGKPDFLAEWETEALASAEPSVDDQFDNPFFKEWLALPPALADIDLRGALYVSREHVPPITPEDRLSSDAVDLLTALVQHPRVAASLKDRLSAVSATDRRVIMDRLLDLARKEQLWGVPDILDACLALAEVDSAQADRLAGFLTELPPGQIRTNIVPKIRDQPWAMGVFNIWYEQAVSPQVKAAITRQRNNGNFNV